MTLKIPIHHKNKGTHDMLIDEEDYDKIKDLNLTLNHQSNPNTFYVKHIVYENQQYIKKIHIHRLIMGLGDFKEDKRIINHIDGNGLNNQKSNLEICDAMYNSQSFRQPNRKCRRVRFENDPKRKMKWRAYITLNGKKQSKRFMTEEEGYEWIEMLINSHEYNK